MPDSIDDMGSFRAFEVEGFQVLSCTVVFLIATGVGGPWCHLVLGRR